jgi:hypothetical protein
MGTYGHWGGRGCLLLGKGPKEGPFRLELDGFRFRSGRSIVEDGGIKQLVYFPLCKADDED